MDIVFLIRQRMRDLTLEQKDLAAAAEVTESYISQLLARKKSPPAPGRTAIYKRIGGVLRIPVEELTRLAEVQRQEELKRKLAKPPRPLFKLWRGLLLKKCRTRQREEIGPLFEKDAFGDLERLVTQKLTDVCREVVRDRLEDDGWMQRLAKSCGQDTGTLRASLLEFLDADALNVAVEQWVPFLEPLINAWEFDLRSFGLCVALSPLLCAGRIRRFQFAEVESAGPPQPEPGFERFVADKSLSGDATVAELEFLSSLRFASRRPGPLYYYRELQSLRDPLHFSASAAPLESLPVPSI